MALGKATARSDSYCFNRKMEITNYIKVKDYIIKNSEKLLGVAVNANINLNYA